MCVLCSGYVSFRDGKKGSWYIQDLCKALKKFGDSLEFMELLTLVNRMVSLQEDPEAIGRKQVPCFASMLTKKLYFRTKP